MQRLLTITVLLGAFASASAPISAEPTWYHAQLHDANGTAINVDFQVTWGRNKAWAQPVWINVTNDNFTGDEVLYAAVTERVHYFDSTHHGGMSFDDAGAPQRVELIYAEDGRFTGNLPRPLHLSAYAAGTSAQALSIKLDGRYLIDPVNGTSTFQLDLAAAAGM